MDDKHGWVCEFSIDGRQELRDTWWSVVRREWKAEEQHMTSPYMVFDGVVEEQYSTLDPVTRLVHHSHIRLLVRRELDDKVHPDLGVCRSAVRDCLNRPTAKYSNGGSC